MANPVVELTIERVQCDKCRKYVDELWYEDIKETHWFVNRDGNYCWYENPIGRTSQLWKTLKPSKIYSDGIEGSIHCLSSKDIKWDPHSPEDRDYYLSSHKCQENELVNLDQAEREPIYPDCFSGLWQYLWKP